MNATDILKRKGLKKSAQRIRVINILKDKGMPMAEDEIKVAMGEIYDRVTFYRTMQALEKAGVVHRILIDNNKSEYAFNVEDGHHSHVHFLCTKCGAVSCLKDVMVADYRDKGGVSVVQRGEEVVKVAFCAYFEMNLIKMLVSQINQRKIPNFETQNKTR